MQHRTACLPAVVFVCRQQAVTDRFALRTALKQSFRFAGSISMQWLLFGSGGHKERPKYGQMAGFDRCNGVLSKQMKCLGNTHYLHPAASFRELEVRSPSVAAS